MLVEGVYIPVTAFREGFSHVFLIWELQMFSTRNVLPLRQPDEDWSFESEFRVESHFANMFVTKICKPSRMLWKQIMDSTPTVVSLLGIKS